VTIINDDSSVISKWSFKLIDDPRNIIYDHHKFIIQATGANVIKLFSFITDEGPNKLECLSLETFRARPEPTLLEHLSDASFLGKLLVIPANVRLDWKVIATSKRSSLFGLVISDEGKKFYNIDTRSHIPTLRFLCYVQTGQRSMDWLLQLCLPIACTVSQSQLKYFYLTKRCILSAQKFTTLMNILFKVHSNCHIFCCGGVWSWKLGKKILFTIYASASNACINTIIQYKCGRNDLLQLISFIMSFQQQVAQLMQDCHSWSATKNKFTKHCIIIKTFLW
jgi:hypothetical protein